MTDMKQDLNRTLFIGDNLPILRGIDSESIDLVATDPPFNKGVKAFQGITAAGKNISYSDVWTWSDVQAEWANEIHANHPGLYSVIHAANAAAGDDMGAFLCWLGVRVLELHRVLKPTGSLYLHCDHTASAWIKGMLDAVFGRAQFRNEIVWRRHSSQQRGSQHAPRSWGNVVDTILYYVKTPAAKINPLRPLTSTEAQKKFPKVDKDGRRYYDDSSHIWSSPNMGARPNLCYKWRGYQNPHPSGWRLSKTRLEEEYQKGNIVIRDDGKLERRKYESDYRGVPIGTLWSEDSLLIHGGSKERTGYPTQKPLSLYERIIKASSNDGDLVLDPFAGCATTCVAAERLGRQWIGIDLNEPAKAIIAERLQREVTGSLAWDTIVRTPTTPPVRTDDGAAVAPELRIVSRRRNAPRLPVREIRAKLSATHGQRCQGCGYEPPHLDYLEVDHKKPRSLGGRDDMTNLTLLCGPCNRRKGHKHTLTELRQFRLAEQRMNEDWWKEEGQYH